jgi:hypothetical protein
MLYFNPSFSTKKQMALETNVPLNIPVVVTDQTQHASVQAMWIYRRHIADMG